MAFTFATIEHAIDVTLTIAIVATAIGLIAILTIL